MHKMADPKYAELPGIATDQPDTYETCSDRGQDTDEDSVESEESETLHLSSLSWLGELEVGGGQEEEESLTQRFARLRCEVTELTEELDSLTESAREGSLVGLHSQVAQLGQQLEGCQLLVQVGTTAAGPGAQLAGQKVILDQLSAQIRDIAQLAGGKPGTTAGSFELYVRGGDVGGAAATADSLPELDRRLARLEGLLGAHRPGQRRVLSSETDGLALSSAVDLLNQRRYTQTAQHLARVEGRLAALNNRMDLLGQQKSLVQKARTASQVSLLYDALESRAALMAVLPEVAARLADLADLQHGSKDWSGRLADTSALQETTDKLLAENRAQVESTQRLLTDGLGGILEKVGRMQDNLHTLAV